MMTKKKASKKTFKLDQKKLTSIYQWMVKSRTLEERLVKMYKQGHGYFWIGGPGEEAFNIPLGMQVKKGEGQNYDYLHLHYRSSGILMPMGLDPKDAMRQMKNTAKDPFSGGRNFGNHFAIKEWNVLPVSSTIETQYATAIGTGITHARIKTDAITIVNGGDAGTAEGEFASCLVWASRPALPLPILMIVTNNAFGISTSYEGQHGEKEISDRARAFQIQSKTINGNDVEESYLAIQEAMSFIRKNRKPYFIESRVSRLYGHSSASGANFVKNEEDCLLDYEDQLIGANIITQKEADKLRADTEAKYQEFANEVVQEPWPSGDTIYDYVYYGQKGKYW